ncbi:metallophosphoesterase family protein [Paenibacillus sp. NPDC058071]|uniref:metallophosphoesterase family protein n=1 Tax=Paenibacillus sp. NPDC058071 TaxID=3346326 RepID=UPI0036DEA1EF
MKIVVVADTHMPRSAKALPKRLVAELSDAKLILHAGDWTSEEVYRELARYAPVEGVAGNNDGGELAKRLGFSKIVRCGGFRIGLTHGHLPNPKRTALRNASLAFSPDEVDAVVFGHSHIPLLKRENGLLLFNPGSPTAKRRQPQYSFGILQTGEQGLKARHIFFD